MNRGNLLNTSVLRRFLSHSIKPASRVEAVLEEGNVFASFTALANKHKAMNLGQGFPSFGSPPFLSTVLSEVCKGDAFSEKGPANLNNQYSKPGEEPTLALKLAEVYGKRFNRKLDPSHICTTVGAQEGIFTMLAAFCNPGDEIAVVTPCFDSYFKSASVLGLNVKGVPLTQTDNLSAHTPSASDFSLNIDTLRSTISQNTKLLLLNTPSSPFGKVFTQSELEGISEVIKEFPGLIVLSDEVYEHMCFDKKPHLHLANIPGMWERTITMFSAGKTFSCTGWRLGYAIGPSDLIHTMKTLHGVINFSTTTPMQKATALAFDLADKANYFQWLPDLLQGKRDSFCAALRRMGTTVYLHYSDCVLCAVLYNPK